MTNYHRNARVRNPRKPLITEYPFWSMLAVLGLVYLSPFVSPLLNYLALAICLYRVVRFDIRTFSLDYCILTPVAMLFRSGSGMALMVYLCLFAAVREIVRKGLRGDTPLVLLLLILNYLVVRMQLSLGNFLLCFSQLLLLYVMLPGQDEDSAERTIKAFCISLLIASCYALLLRNTWQLRGILGREVVAYQGASQRRFQGLLRDPNYYMCLLVMGIALLLKLGESRRVDPVTFWLFNAGFSVFGILTYSKTFFLLFVLLVAIYVYQQFRNGKYLWGIGLVILIAALGGFLLFSPRSPFSVVLTRFMGANNLSDLTTGRTDVLWMYFTEIFKDPASALFGKGLAAEGLYKDPHNLFVEITYYTGLTGLVLMVAFYLENIRPLGRRSGEKEPWHSRYMVLIVAAVAFCTLHGMYSNITYAVLYLASLPLLLPKRKGDVHG